MNVQLLEQAKASITNGQLDMNTWSACIACHVAQSLGYTMWNHKELCESLGIDHSAAQRLFHMSNWPVSFLDGYSKEDVIAAQQAGTCWARRMAGDKVRACQRIDYFIATDGTDDPAFIKQEAATAATAVTAVTAVEERELVTA